MVPLFQHFLYHCHLFDHVNFTLKLKESLVVLASVKSVNSILSLLIFVAGSSLQNCYKIPDAFE